MQRSLEDSFVFCVYRITCTANGRVYIGRSIHPRRRRYGHFVQLRCGKHSLSKLQADYDRYGECAFEFQVLSWHARDDVHSTAEASAICEHAKLGGVYNRIIPKPEKILRERQRYHTWSQRLALSQHYNEGIWRLRKIWSREQVAKEHPWAGIDTTR